MATFYHCGICEHYHNALWDGDCRQDDARYIADDLDQVYGVCEWQEIDMADVDQWRFNHA